MTKDAPCAKKRKIPPYNGAFCVKMGLYKPFTVLYNEFVRVCPVQQKVTHCIAVI